MRASYRTRLKTATLALSLLWLPQCSDKEQSEKYDLGMNKPAWGEAMQYIVSSLKLSASKDEPQKATALAALAVDICEDCAPMRPYAQLTLAFAQVQRGDAGGFFRQTSRACKAMQPDMKHTQIVLDAATTLDQKKMRTSGRKLLKSWLERLDEGGPDDAKKATQRMLKSLGSRDRKPKTQRVETPPPKDFPIVLDEQL